MFFFKPSSKVRQLIKVFNFYLPVIFKDVKCFDSFHGLLGTPDNLSQLNDLPYTQSVTSHRADMHDPEEVS